MRLNCSKTGCTAPAEFIVKIHARTKTGDDPIELVLGIRVCGNHRPTVDDVITRRTWDILDTWALNGRFKLCDRSLTELILVSLFTEEGQALAAMLAGDKPLNG
jgi:hypothetical protein